MFFKVVLLFGVVILGCEKVETFTFRGCAGTVCPPGTICQQLTVQCVNAPCFPQPTCVPFTAGPSQTRPGFCPRQTFFWSRLRCHRVQDFCQSDHDCNGIFKCCRCACGNRCVVPSRFPFIG